MTGSFFQCGRPLVLVILLALVLATTGCQSYSEKFTYVDPKSGHTNQIVNVTYRSFLQFG